MDIETTCLYCGKTFKARKADYVRGRAKYCSRKCAGVDIAKNRIKVTELTCNSCGKKFPRHRFRKSKSGLYFCERKCMVLAQRKFEGLKDMHPNHYKQNKRNYRKLAFYFNDKKCDICGYNSDLTKLEVHHVDRDHNNSRLENLQILCRKCHKHMHV